MATVYVRKDNQKEFQPATNSKPSGCYEEVVLEESVPIVDEEGNPVLDEDGNPTFTEEVTEMVDMCLLMPGYKPNSYDKAEDNGDGTGTWADGRTDTDLYAELVAMGTEAITEFIQVPVDNYNAANGLEFVSVHNCNSYIQSPNYAHYQFCQEVWDWSVEVWEEGRVIQDEIATGVTPPPESKEEFWEMLTPYTGTGA